MTVPDVGCVVAPDLSSLRPHTLPVIPRLNLLSGALNRMHQYKESHGYRKALVLVGEGGMGKSVLLGQVIDQVSGPDNAKHQSMHMAPGAVTLVTCASVSPGAALTNALAVDEAFGASLNSEVQYYGGVLGLLSAQKVKYGSAALLIDTVDLIISDRSLSAVAAFIVTALEIADVTLTCRTYEYNNYLQETAQSAPRLDNHLLSLNLPTLSVDEIVTWARTYIEQTDRRALGEEAGFLRSLRGGISQNGPLRQVCSVPVRLAITCETFSAGQHVPEDLTVTDLYDAYWQDRISRDKGKAATADSDAKEYAALEVAAQTVTSEEKIVLHVPKGRLSAGSLRGLRLLASEGVLRDLGTAWEFFHQTFAEYSYARWLLTQGITAETMTRLGSGLRSGKASLWPVVRSLLLQIPDDSEYQTVAEQLALVGPEGIYTQAIASLRRAGSESLQALLRGISGAPELLTAALPALADAPPRHIATAFNAASDALSEHATIVGRSATATLALLLPRAAKQDLPDMLNRALTSLLAARGQVPQVTWEQFAATLLRPLVTVPQLAEALPILCARYKSLSGAGRQAVVRIYLAQSLSAEEIVSFAQVALSTARPPLEIDEATSILEIFWGCPEVRELREWRSWRDLASTRLPQEWDKSQINFIANMALHHEGIGLEVIGDLLGGHVTNVGLHVNVYKRLVELKPEWVARELLKFEPPSDALSASGITEGIKGFVPAVNSATREALIRWLKPCRDLSPRSVWPAQISLAFNSVPTHEAIFSDLIEAGESNTTMASAIDTWLFNSPKPVLSAMATVLRPLLRAEDVRTRGVRARLEGRLVLSDVEARGWVEREMLSRSSPRVAGTAIKTIFEFIEADAEQVSTPICRWLAGLISSPHTDATQRVAAFLGRSPFVGDAVLSPVASGLASSAIDRMQRGIQKREDSQLQRELLELLVRSDRLVPIPAEQVRAVYRVIQNRVAGQSADQTRRFLDDGAAAIRDMGHFAGTLLSRGLSAGEGRELIGNFLLEIDDKNFGNRIVKVILSMLIGLSHHDPDAAAWMEEIFGDERLAMVVKLAIARAIMQIDGDHIGGRASRLKDRVDCPPEVVTYIVPRLRQ